MELCIQNNSLTQNIVISRFYFSKITIINQNIEHYWYPIIRALESAEIINIKLDYFFPVIQVDNDIVEAVHNQQFYGPNISYTFKAEHIQVQFQHYVQTSTYQIQQCSVWYLMEFSFLKSKFALLCQYENKTVTISSNNVKYQNQSFKYIYELDIPLNQSYNVVQADNLTISIINIYTQQVRVFEQVNNTDQEVIPYQREKKFYCTLFVEYIQCIKQDKNFTFYLSYIERFKLNQKVRHFGFAEQIGFLILVTQNYVIVIHVFLDNDVVQNFQLIQIFQSKNEIKQFYYSYYTLYIISSHRGYLSIQKYYEISQFHFKYLGEIDCLGYQIEDQINIMQGINGAEDYYFINSFNDVIVFQLSRSLQDSFQYVIPNATFLQSKKKSFCLLQDQQVQCYNIAFGHSIFNVDIDKFNTFSSVPYQICAQNFKYKKCANYDLKLILIQQKLIVNGYQLIEISYGSQYEIKFDIKQGYIKDLSILDGQAELVDNNAKILEFNKTIVLFQELQDVILLKFLNLSMMIYDKKRQDLEEIKNISCLQAYFLTQNHLLCAFKSNILFIYLCDEKWNCAFRNQFLLKNQVIDIQVSGTFVLLNQSTQQQILQYSPKTYELNNIFDLQNSDPTYIQYINQNDFWLIQIWDWQLNINRFITLQKQYEGNIHYIERFNQDNLFTNGDDRIQTIEILAYDQNSISLLFMMKHSIPKAYQIRIDHDQVHLQSLFVLIVNKSEIQKYSFQNNLLVITTRNNMVFYNVSLELNQFERNIIFNLDINKTLGVQEITRINHFYLEEKVYLFAQKLQLCLYQLDIHYKIKMLNYDEKTQINLNSMNENITMTLEVQYQSDSINMLQIALALVIISIISLFCTLKWCLYFRR